jgi:glutamate N-acetyltransferase/amino-acid N-acetyltransferase
VVAGLVPAIGVFYADASSRGCRTKPDMTTENVMSTAVSPLAPANVPDMPPISGVRLATAEAGIRYAGRTDVLLALFDPGTIAAGVFTRSKCPSAPVEWCRAHLKTSKTRALVVNRQCQRLHGQDRAMLGTPRRSLRVRLAEAGRCVSWPRPAIGEPLNTLRRCHDGLVTRAQPGELFQRARS